jgi:hypothetical protein
VREYIDGDPGEREERVCVCDCRAAVRVVTVRASLTEDELLLTSGTVTITDCRRTVFRLLARYSLAADRRSPTISRAILKLLLTRSELCLQYKLVKA